VARHHRSTRSSDRDMPAASSMLSRTTDETNCYCSSRCFGHDSLTCDSACSMALYTSMSSLWARADPFLKTVTQMRVECWRCLTV
jgi:hypothetical protein